MRVTENSQEMIRKLKLLAGRWDISFNTDMLDSEVDMRTLVIMLVRYDVDFAAEVERDAARKKVEPEYLAMAMLDVIIRDYFHSLGPI